MKKSILYIGNKLNKTNSNISYISVLGNLLSNEGYIIHYASSYGNKIIRMFHMAYSVLKLKTKVNTVLIDTYSSQNFYYAFVVSQLCRMFKLDYIPILHGGNLPLRLRTHPRMSTKIFENAKANVSPSGYIKNAFENQGYSNIIRIPNTLRIENYEFSKKEFEVPKLLWVRSFSKIYNPEMAVKVLYLLKFSFPDAELCMVGPNSDGSKDSVRQLAKELKVKVEFTGKLEKQKWIDLSTSYNVFINTTNFDNTPISVMEAMALGLPIVSTNVGGMPYLVQNGMDGILVEPDDDKMMAEAILKVMRDQKFRQNLIIKAREKAEQFDWQMIKPKWEALLS